MHILIVPSWYSSKRNPVHGSFFKEQAKALQSHGHKVTVAYNEIWPLTLFGKVGERPGVHFQVEDGIPTYRFKNYNFLPKNPLMFKVFNKRLEKLLRKIKDEQGMPDIIHAHSSLWAGISAEYISKKYNLPLVITEHSYLSKSKYLKSSYLPLVKRSYDSARKIIVVGSGLKEELEKFTYKKDITIVPNTVDFGLFKINTEVKKNKKFRFFSLAFLDYEKGMDLIIKAIAEDFKEEAVELYIGGDGAYKGELENLTRQLGLESKVKFLGALSREQASREMQLCDAFVLASRFETFGVVYIEALASGKPVIGTRNGGAEDIINKRNGILVESENVRALAKAMRSIIDNYDTYVSEEIRQDCVNNYSEETIVEKLNVIYKEIINE